MSVKESQNEPRMYAAGPSHSKSQGLEQSVTISLPEEYLKSCREMGKPVEILVTPMHSQAGPLPQIGLSEMPQPFRVPVDLHELAVGSNRGIYPVRRAYPIGSRPPQEITLLLTPMINLLEVRIRKHGLVLAGAYGFEVPRLNGEPILAERTTKCISSPYVPTNPALLTALAFRFTNRYDDALDWLFNNPNMTPKQLLATLGLIEGPSVIPAAEGEAGLACSIKEVGPQLSDLQHQWNHYFDQSQRNPNTGPSFNYVFALKRLPIDEEVRVLLCSPISFFISGQFRQAL